MTDNRKSTTEKLTDIMTEQTTGETSEQPETHATEPTADRTAARIEQAAPPRGLEHPAYEVLETKLTETEAKVSDYWNQLLRAKAEHENMLRRVERDIAGAHKFALEKFVLELLPVIDSLERAMMIKGDGNDFLKQMHDGIALTQGMFLKALEKFGVKQIHPLGEFFNPAHHQAISTRASGEAAPKTVIEVMQKGYLLHDRLIRPALVVVAT